jgi:hypothetical protein
MRSVEVGAAAPQPDDHAYAVDAGNVARQPSVFGAPAQPNINRPSSWLSARQPAVCIAVTWVATAGWMSCVQPSGGGTSLTTESSSGRPRANHSATTSKSSCVSSGCGPRGICTRVIHAACSVEAAP